jgi:hypothetical protein
MNCPIKEYEERTVNDMAQKLQKPDLYTATGC